MKISATITNLPSFKVSVEKAIPTRNQLRAMVEAGARVAVEGERSRVHVDTGNLRDSIGFDDVEFEGDERASTLVGPSDERAPQRDVSPYATVEEYRVGGNAMGAPFSGPHAYVRPTADEDAGDIISAIEAAARRSFK